MESIKWRDTAADIGHMIISDDEAKNVARSMRETCADSCEHAHPRVPEDLLRAAKDAAAQAPELRTDRIEHARTYLDSGDVDSRAVAEKMMCRIMSDWMR